VYRPFSFCRHGGLSQATPQLVWEGARQSLRDGTTLAQPNTQQSTGKAGTLAGDPDE